MAWPCTINQLCADRLHKLLRWALIRQNWNLPKDISCGPRSWRAIHYKILLGTCGIVMYGMGNCTDKNACLNSSTGRLDTPSLDLIPRYRNSTQELPPPLSVPIIYRSHQSAKVKITSPPRGAPHPTQRSTLQLLILCLKNYGQLPIPKHQFPTNVSNYDSNLSGKEKEWLYTNIFNTDIFWGGKYGARHSIPGTDLVVRHLPGPRLWSTPNQSVPLKVGVLLLVFFSMPRCDPLFWCGGCATCASPVQPPLAFCHRHKRTPASPSTPATLHPYLSRQPLWLTM